MAAGVSAENLGDLIIMTRRNVGENKLTQIAQTLTDYPAAREVFRRNRMDLDSGPYYEFHAMTGLTRNARWVNLYEPDNLAQSDVSIKGLVTLKNLTTGYIWDARELDMNRGELATLDLIQARRLDMMIDNVEQFETRWWRLTASTDAKTIYSTLPYFVVKASSAGFTATLPGAYTTVANISPTTYSAWANWADAYTNPSVDDLITKMVTACYRTSWRPAANVIPDYASGKSMARAFYCNLDTTQEMENLLRAQNDNIGSDLAAFYGSTTFKRSPVVYVPHLNDDTTDPVYGLQWDQWKTAVLRGWWMRETVIPVRQDAHTTASLHLDWTLGMVCHDRRTQFVISNGTTQL